MKKIAIIGASYLQSPLILKAKEMGYETHVFAWQVGDIGEEQADFFYPISIVEKEQILEKCREIGINGICSISSDLAMVAVNYVADSLGLAGNTLSCTKKTTNKYEMRNALSKSGISCPKYIVIGENDTIADFDLNYPVIVKPTDRSGSRGVTKITSSKELEDAIIKSQEVGFEKRAIVEEFITGKEYSVESISYNGKHKLLAITEKFTTGTPNFIETGHIEPALFSDKEKEEIQRVVFSALDALEVRNGASHSEIMVSDGKITIVEIGARMGGDKIGSSLVPLTTGIDFVKNVILVAMGEEPEFEPEAHFCAAGIRFIFDENDIAVYNKVKEENAELIIESEIEAISDRSVTDSSTRFGCFVLAGDDREIINSYISK